MKPNQEWGFTAAPDFPRICRELGQTGCVVGLVTMKGETPVTLIDTRTARVPAGMASRPVAGAPSWHVVAGNASKAALGVRPVRVEGFTATRLTEPAPVAPPNPDAGRLASLRMFIASKADATWTTGDGSKVRVQAMSDSHLHFALAKAYRGEYVDSASRLAGIDALKAEAARRLLRTWGLAPEPAKVAVDTETQTVKPGQTAPQPIGRVVSYEPGSARISLFGMGAGSGGTSGIFDFKTSPPTSGPLLVAEAQRRVEAATRSLIGAPVVLTPDGRLSAQKKIQQTIQDSLGAHYSVDVDLVGGPFGLTANVKVEEKPAGRMDRDYMPPYMRSPFDR